MGVCNLKNESIDNIIFEIIKVLKGYSFDSRTVNEIRIAAEEILLKYQELFGVDANTEIKIEKRFGHINVSLLVTGERCDPFRDASDEDLLFHNTMENIGYAPSWTYKKGVNSIVFSLKKPQKIAQWVVTLSAALMGTVLGYAAQFLPFSIKSTLIDTLLSPLSSAIMGLLGTMAVLMIFLSVISGICGMGDMATFNRIGKRMLGRFMMFLVIITAGGIIGISFIFPITASGSGKFDFASLWEMLLQIIPDNIIEAFSTGNTLQIIFLATLIGIVALSLIKKMNALTEWTLQLNALVQSLIEILIKVLPVVVFISMFTLLAKNDIKNLKSIYKFPLFHLLFCAAWVLILLLKTCIMQKVKFTVLFKKLIPTLIITLSTASSSASFTTSVDICNKKLGIDKKLVNVGAPLSHALYRPTAIIEDIVGVFCLAEVFNVEITWSAVITLAITVIILSLATPSLPGAAISCFALLFTQCGIPSAALSLIIALDPIIDRITTASVVMSQQLELIGLAASLDKIDKDVLRK